MNHNLLTKLPGQHIIFYVTVGFSLILILIYLYYNNDYFNITSTQFCQEYIAKNKIKPHESSNSNSDPTNTERNKLLFCLIKTTPGALTSNKTLTTFKVWASKCSNYRFITLIPKENLASAITYDNHMEISSPFYLLQPEGRN